MLKKLFICFFIIALLFAMLTGCKKNNEDAGALINGDSVDESSTAELEDAFNATVPTGLPDGFPKEVPFYKNAEILEADTYGTDGYTVVYMVDDTYKNVVEFYMEKLDALNQSDVGEDEAYFEGIDIGEVHINGLTITDADGVTQVFITLRDYGIESNDAEEDDNFGDDTESSEVIKYEDAEEVSLSKGYPSDIVPIYSKAKVISSSSPSSGDLFVVDLILPSKSYKEVVAYYKDALNMEPDNYKSQVMETATFTGEKDGWKFDVTVGSNPSIDFNSVSITLQK